MQNSTTPNKSHRNGPHQILPTPPLRGVFGKYPRRIFSKRGGFRHLTLLQLKDLDGEVEALNLGANVLGPFFSGFLFGWWKLKYFWNVHPDPWGDDPI